LEWHTADYPADGSNSFLKNVDAYILNETVKYLIPFTAVRISKSLLTQ
jgi:hypothetical protein